MKNWRKRTSADPKGRTALAPFLWALFFLLQIVPITPALGARLFDYTHRAFTLSGGLGLRYEDYEYRTGGETSYSRRTLEEELRLGSTGFIWDPRFLLFDAGVTLRNRNTDYQSGESDIDTVDYRISTTWFRERNPFILYARKTTNTFTPAVGSPYEFITSNYGFRWRFAPPLLGTVNFGYDRGHSKSDSLATAPFDRYKDSFNIDGKRTFGKVYKIYSVVNYGYRYDDSEDDVAGRYYRQKYWYVQDNTRFSEKVNLRANFTYYDRSDRFDGVTNGGSRKLDSSHTNLNVGLNVSTSEKLSHYYNLGVTLNDVDDSSVDNYNLVAGMNYRFAPYWSSRGALRFISTSSSNGNSTVGDRTAYGVDAGVAYTRTYGDISARAGYDLGIEIPQSSDYDEDTIVSHSLGAGYTGRWSPLYMDSLNYRLNYQTGSRYESADRKRVEHNLNYIVNSRLSGTDSLRTVLNYRDWKETASGSSPLDNSNRTLRGDVTWNRRFWLRNTFTMSAGIGDTRSSSGGGVANYSFWYSQARVTMNPWRRTKLTAMARYEDRSGDTSNIGPKLTLEANLNYTLAKWQMRLQYLYHDANYEAGAYEDSWLTFYLTRNFGVRF